jgi:hypothetical protein
VPESVQTYPASWPRYLTRAQAALYLGVGVDTFTAELRAGLWPPGRPRGGRGGLLTWDRLLLDRAADAFAELSNARPAPPATDAAAPAGDAWERRIHEQTQGQRPQHGHQAAARR